MNTVKKDIEITDPVMACLGYVFLVPAIYVLVAERYKTNFFVKEHAKKALALCLLWVTYTQLKMVFYHLFALLPQNPMQSLFLASSHLLTLAAFFLWLLLMVTSLRGKTLPIPFLDGLIRKVEERIR